MKTTNSRLNKLKARIAPEPERPFITIFKMDGHYYLTNPIRPQRGDPDIELTQAQVDEYELTHTVIMVSYAEWVGPYNSYPLGGRQHESDQEN